MDVEVKPVGAEEAETVHAVVHAAFEARPALDPPAAALSETREELEGRLARHGGLLARVDGVPAGALVLDPVGTTMYLRRVGVVPAMQHHHVAQALIDAAVEAAEGYADLTVVAREELPATIAFWEHQGFREVRRDPPDVELRRPLRTAVHHAADADAMRALGRSVAGQLTAGDLIVLTGSLGAGKTTFTQGLGAGLGVRGAITSPTFVIARVHRSEVGGPALVHVDAYRLGGIDELDDLDLDTSLDEAVTVVEWGEGLAESLSESRLEVSIVRDDPDDVRSERRRVEITPVGPRWQAFSFRGLR
ncbi:MAG TPA: tRNA (adenosine(37)-N6)-threonylcarbamoyltransferase complex ATPase subunit type 1 TsaE [Nocardioides sp.]|uniref:tRNA (adenosine(37)-N6)-threonylcarbamoyltransferase complex ATPase subunit type 1 TsaE n=1 Tax=Nocardioides sp. TaxID=35761 RepID=UPI002E2F57D3|nr:tRNA (adenosine(37)-N6)-threonylcarbamoyltransferase complex ATPase subunit type 1 TsaE [Nocardioides sp.]HEX5090681.1 tRNA (adenosine(37)-N6)-threonylcarbamoyltransferase complex ATPase subunit type 1 TsaE [Nocardioides sp.]